MSDSEDDYAYEYSDDDDDDNEEETSTTKAPQEGSESDNDEEKKPPATSLKTPSSKEGNANPNAPPTGGGRSSLSPAGDAGSSPQANKSGVRLLSAGDLAVEMSQVLSEIGEMLSVPPEAAGALMRVVKFNKERLLNGFMEDDDKLLSKAGVYKRVRCPKAPPLKEESPGRNTRSCEAKKKEDCECGICCDNDFEPAEMYSMSCGHSFCRDCWSGFVGNKLTDGPSCVYAKCPEAGCEEVVTSVEVGEVGGDVEEWRRWELRR